MQTDTELFQVEHQINLFEWILKFIGHVMGGSALLLPYAMGQTGIIPFVILLAIELYVTGNSLNLFCEMAKSEEGIDHANYFSIVEKHLGSRQRMTHYAIRCTFFFDVIICSAIYFKLAEELCFSYFADMANPRDRSAYRVSIFFSIAIFLLISEFVSRCIADSRSRCQSVGPTSAQSEVSITNRWEVTINNSNIESFQLGHKSSDGNMDRWKLNMNDVVRKLHGYSSLRYFLLLLFSFLVYALVSLFWTICNMEEFTESDHSQCPGIFEPFLLPELDIKILPAVSVIIFSLMHYTIFLPICLEELKLPEKEYGRLVRIASIVLLVILTVIPLTAHFTFGESAPVLFTSGYGHSLYGKIFFCLALAITLVAMLLRIIGCCKLIQVLFRWESSSHFGIITICVFLCSFVVASMSETVLYLVILAGSVNCNLLLIILPRMAYIRFKREDSWMSYGIISTMVCAILHSLLLLSTIVALIYAEPNVGQHCSNVFNEYWSQ